MGVFSCSTNNHHCTALSQLMLCKNIAVLRTFVAMHRCEDVVQANKLVIVLQAQQASKQQLKGILLT